MPNFASMIIVLLFLWISAALGYLLRRHPQHWVGPMTTYIIWLLLFLLGMEVGSNRELMRSLGTLGVESLLASICMVAGSGLAALVFAKSIRSLKKNRSLGTEATDAVSLWHQMKDSLVIVVFFTLGLVSGVTLPSPPLPEAAGYWTLCVLMGTVGFSIGQNDEVRRSIRNLDKRLMLLPLATILGTWGGMLVVSVLIPRLSVSEWMAVGSGFGYYSLSGIMISELKGAEIGTIALMSNIIRELITLVASPFLLRWFGPLAPITAGGCTTEDTTLPVIARTCGKELVPVSIFHGLTIDFSVPFLISFFCSI